MYRAQGDSRFASVGEVEYTNGVGAAFASGCYGPIRACAGIVGRVDLTLGGFAEEVLRACMDRAPDRFRGIRHMAAWDASPEANMLVRPPPKDLLLDPRFREGFAVLSQLGLSFDAYLTAPIIEDTARWIARNLPFVDHVALIGLENTGFAIANDGPGRSFTWRRGPTRSFRKRSIQRRCFGRLPRACPAFRCSPT
jgi:hypothetical protein